MNQELLDLAKRMVTELEVNKCSRKASLLIKEFYELEEKILEETNRLNAPSLPIC